MAIIYTTPSGTGTLSPPILNDITNINSPSGQNFTLFSDVLQQFTGSECLFDYLGAVDLNSGATITLSCVNISANSTTTEINATNLLSLNSNVTIEINNAIQIGGASTLDILAIPSPIKGTMIYNNTLDAFFFYQNSPITGLVLGWYNATGTIKL